MKITQHSFGCQTIEEEFTGKNLTLFVGLGLVSKFFGGLRLCKTLRILDKQFPRRENGYEVSHLILALIYGLIVGKFRPYEISLALVNDKVFKKLTGLNSFPSQSTFSRFLSWVRLAVSEELSNINLRLLRQLRGKFKGYIQGLTIDLDSHVKTVYGNQEGANVGYNHRRSIGTRRQEEFLGHIEGESAYCAGKADKSQWQMDIAIK